MSLGRLNIQTAGYFVLQDFDVNDVFAVAYNEALATPKNRPINHGARYTTVLDANGIPRFRRVASTSGPIGGFFVWPGKAPRILGQWAQVFPAKISSTSPLKATPVSTGAGGVWTLATDLDELAVSTSDGSTPAVGTVGLVVVGTELGAQNPLFFQGGSGTGTTGGTLAQSFYRVISYSGAGIYVLRPYDKPRGTATGAADETNCEEDNGSVSVPTNQWVRGTKIGSKVYFIMPLGAC